MSSLRRTNQESDVEAQTDPSVESAAPVTVTNGASNGTSSHYAAASGHNPAFLGRAICRKVLTMLTTANHYSEDGTYDLTKPRGMLILLKEVVLGVIAGVALISIFVTLDHLNIFHFQSAHNFRNSAFALFSDPETIATLEEATEYKFMTMSEYEAMREEINSSSGRFDEIQADIDKQEAQLEEKTKEADAMRSEWETLMASPLLELEKFCETCIWAQKTTCAGRMQFMIDTYGLGKVSATYTVMNEVPTCKKE